MSGETGAGDDGTHFSSTEDLPADWLPTCTPLRTPDNVCEEGEHAPRRAGACPALRLGARERRQGAGQSGLHAPRLAKVSCSLLTSLMRSASMAGRAGEAVVSVVGVVVGVRVRNALGQQPTLQPTADARAPKRVATADTRLGASLGA